MTGEREGGGRRVVPFLYSRGRDIGYQLLVADEQRLGTPASEQLIRSLPPGTSPPGTVFLTHLAGGVRTVFRKEPLESARFGLDGAPVDRSGRGVIVTFGWILPAGMTSTNAPWTAQDLQRCRDAVAGDLQRAWTAQEELPARSAEPIVLPVRAGEPLRVLTLPTDGRAASREPGHRATASPRPGPGRSRAVRAVVAVALAVPLLLVLRPLWSSGPDPDPALDPALDPAQADRRGTAVCQALASPDRQTAEKVLETAWPDSSRPLATLLDQERRPGSQCSFTLEEPDQAQPVAHVTVSSKGRQSEWTVTLAPPVQALPVPPD
ncbi:hypothetical protein JCM9957A_22430 [Kineosporia succinea]